MARKSTPRPPSLLLFQLGNAGSNVDLGRALELVNRAQSQFEVVLGNTVGISSSGRPDAQLWYADAFLFPLFPGTHPIELGVTLNAIEGNWFIRQDMDTKRVVVSMYQVDDPCQRAGRTKDEYLAQAMVSQWLYLQWHARGQRGASLYHSDTRNCLFDFVEYKPDIEHKLAAGHICDGCRRELGSSGVSDTAVAAVESVLHAIQIPGFWPTTRQAFANSLLSLAIGGLLGGLAVNLASTWVTSGLTRISVVVVILTLLVGLSAVGINYLVVRKRAEAKLRLAQR